MPGAGGQMKTLGHTSPPEADSRFSGLLGADVGAIGGTKPFEGVSGLVASGDGGLGAGVTSWEAGSAWACPAPTRTWRVRRYRRLVASIRRSMRMKGSRASGEEFP